MKLYYHKTDGGAEYLTDTYIDTKMDKKTGEILEREGTFTDKTKYIVRIDGDITKDAELRVKKPLVGKKDLAKYLADYIEQEKVCVARHYGEGAQRNRNITDIIEQALDAFESTQEKVVTITEGGE